MFDTYVPAPAVACPWCGLVVDTWQGKDGPNLLFVWRQGEPHPVGHPVDEDYRLDPSRFIEFELPPEFHVAGYCPNSHVIRATGRCADGTWRLLDMSDAERQAADDAERVRIRRLRE